MSTYIPGVTDIFPEPSLFTPDFSFIDKMLQRRQGMYEQGFAQVNSKYNIVNRDVTHAFNQQMKDRFLKDARNNLKNLSAMDLSQQENVDAATEVFSPFVKNTNILGDQAITQHWREQIGIGENYRQKDGGKEFSEENVEYIRMQQRAFANSDPNSWRQFYENKRFYTPWYDVDKEIAEAMKNYKPNDIERPSFNGFYIFKTRDASTRPEDVKRYLEGVLSDNAKRQMRISGAVRYGSTPEQISPVYKQIAEQNIKEIDERINKIRLDVKTEKNPEKNNQLKKQISDLEDVKNSYTQDVARIKTGDLSFLKDKAESVAYDIFYNEKINKAAKAYSRIEYKQDVTVNSAAVDVWKDGQVWARQKDQQEFELKKEKGLIGGMFLTGNIPVGEEDIIRRGFGNLTSEYDKIKSEVASSSKEFSNVILQYFKNDGIRDKNDDLTLADIEKNPYIVSKFVEKFGDKPEVREYVKFANESAQKLLYINNIVSNAKSQVLASLTPQQKAGISSYVQESKSFGDIVLREGNRNVVFKPDQIAKGIVDGSVTTKFIGDVAVVRVNGTDYALNWKSKDPTTVSSIRNLNGLIKLAKRNPELSSVLESYNKSVQNYLSSTTARTDVTKIVGDESKIGKEISSFIKGYIPLSEGTIDIKGIQQSPSTNRTYFGVSSSGKAKIKDKNGDIVSLTEDNLVDLLKAQGLTVGKSSIGGIYIESEQLVANNSMYSTYTPIEKWMANKDPYLGSGQSSGFWWPLDKQITVDPKTKRTYRLPAFRYEKSVIPDALGYQKPVYYLYDDAGGSFLKKYNNLHDLFIDAKSLSLDLGSYVKIKQSNMR